MATLTTAQEMIAALEALSKSEQEERMRLSFEASNAAAAWKETETRLVREKQEMVLNNLAITFRADANNCPDSQERGTGERSAPHERRGTWIEYIPLSVAHLWR